MMFTSPSSNSPSSPTMPSGGSKGPFSLPTTVPRRSKYPTFCTLPCGSVSGSTDGRRKTAFERDGIGAQRGTNQTRTISSRLLPPSTRTRCSGFSWKIGMVLTFFPFLPHMHRTRGKRNDRQKTCPPKRNRRPSGDRWNRLGSNTHKAYGAGQTGTKTALPLVRPRHPPGSIRASIPLVPPLRGAWSLLPPLPPLPRAPSPLSSCRAC
mmetsp:Transcript_42184/g.108640  ORF Transcript_42184/g.108640 Transcript_42184/m.108640 type:complete len:208 (-) Transcript_42184:3102-3725(-)